MVNSSELRWVLIYAERLAPKGGSGLPIDQTCSTFPLRVVWIELGTVSSELVGDQPVEPSHFISNPLRVVWIESGTVSSELVGDLTCSTFPLYQ